MTREAEHKQRVEAVDGDGACSQPLAHRRSSGAEASRDGEQDRELHTRVLRFLRWRADPVSLWAHNDHVLKPGAQMMGDYLNRALGKRYFNIIFLDCLSLAMKA